MTFKEIMTELKKGVYRPIYFLMGDEPYFIDKITDFITQNALTPDQKDFNQTVIYGKDATVALIDNTARRCPMMSEKMVVIVKEAQNVKNIENLVYYAQKPPKCTILVINYKQKTFAKNYKLQRN
jgi:DNA polymerase-3 subunit delta